MIPGRYFGSNCVEQVPYCEGIRIKIPYSLLEWKDHDMTITREAIRHYHP